MQNRHQLFFLVFGVLTFGERGRGQANWDKIQSNPEVCFYRLPNNTSAIQSNRYQCMENTNSSVGLQMYLQVRVKMYRQMYRQVIATGDCGGQNQWRLSSAIRIWGVRSKEPINVPLKPPFMRFQFQWSLWDWRVSNGDPVWVRFVKWFNFVKIF